MKNLLQFLTEAGGSRASEQAKKLNLKSDGHGSWFDSRGKMVAVTDKGKLKFTKSSLPSLPKWSQCKPHVDRNGNLKKGKIPASVQKITDDIYNELKDNSAKGLSKYTETQAKKVINTQSQSYRFSKLCGLRWLKWFNTAKESDRAMRELYLYASSQGDGACIHYKLS